MLIEFIFENPKTGQLDQLVRLIGFELDCLLGSTGVNRKKEQWVGDTVEQVIIKKKIFWI